MTTRYDCNGYRTGGHIGATFDKVASDMSGVERRLRRTIAMLAALSPTRWIPCGSAAWCIVNREGLVLAEAGFYGGQAWVRFGEARAEAPTMREAVAQIPELPPFDAPLPGWQRALGHARDRQEHHDGRAFWHYYGEWVGTGGERSEYAPTLEELFKRFGWTDFAEVAR